MSLLLQPVRPLRIFFCICTILWHFSASEFTNWKFKRKNNKKQLPFTKAYSIQFRTKKMTINKNGEHFSKCDKYSRLWKIYFGCYFVAVHRIGENRWIISLDVAWLFTENGGENPMHLNIGHRLDLSFLCGFTDIIQCLWCSIKWSNMTMWQPLNVTV